MGLSSLLYPLYESRLARQLDPSRMPRHIGVILDGNRRWAKALGTPASHGHQKGADKISELLTWCADAGVDVVTLWMLSTDNLSRSSQELSQLLDIICDAVGKIADDGRWRLRVSGSLDLLPETASMCLAEAEARNRKECPDATSLVVNVAVGYGGRHEITDAVRTFLRAKDAEGMSLAEVADQLTVEDITANLYTAGLPDPDLVIRTSGEQRLGGFLLWQSVHSEYYFCETYWPDFRRTDFLRALRDYARRERRMGR